MISSPLILFFSFHFPFLLLFLYSFFSFHFPPSSLPILLALFSLLLLFLYFNSSFPFFSFFPWPFSSSALPFLLSYSSTCLFISSPSFILFTLLLSFNFFFFFPFLSSPSIFPFFPLRMFILLSAVFQSLPIPFYHTHTPYHNTQTPNTISPTPAWGMSVPTHNVEPIFQTLNKQQIDFINTCIMCIYCIKGKIFVLHILNFHLQK